jgi:hypothetical protein
MGVHSKSYSGLIKLFFQIRKGGRCGNKQNSQSGCGKQHNWLV